MTRYADPGRCPDCREPLPPGVGECPSCGLTLSGPLGRDLFQTLAVADSLLERMRADSPAWQKGAAASASTAAPGAGTQTAPAPAREGTPRSEGPHPPAAAVPPPSAPHGLSGASVPRILLGLGAACLLVAALVFLAVSWSVMGVGGRTAVLLAGTALMAVLTRWTAQGGLRAAVESLGLVTLGLVALDVSGAGSAGWLGDLSDAGVLVAVGVVVGAASIGAVLALRRTPASGFVAGEVVTGVSAAAVGIGTSAGDWGAFEGRLTVGVLAAVAVSALCWRLGLRVGAWSVGLVAGLGWAALALVAVFRAAEHASVRELWGQAQVWPLIVALAIVAAPVGLGRAPRPARVLAASAALVLLATALAMPALDESPSRSLMAMLAVASASVAFVALLRQPWALAGLGLLGLAWFWVLGNTAVLSATTAQRWDEVNGLAWAGRPGDSLTELPIDPDQPAGWLLPLCLVVLVAAAFAVAQVMEPYAVQASPGPPRTVAPEPPVSAPGRPLVGPVEPASTERDGSAGTPAHSEAPDPLEPARPQPPVGPAEPSPTPSDPSALGTGPGSLTPSPGTRAVRGPARVPGLLTRQALLVTGVVGAAGSVAALALYPVPVALVLVADLALATALVVAGVLRGTLMPVLAGAGVLWAGVLWSVYDEWLTAGALAVVLGLSALLYARHPRRGLAEVAGAAVALATVAQTWTAGALVDAAQPQTALVALLLVAALAALLPFWPGPASPGRPPVRAVFRRPGAPAKAAAEVPTTRRAGDAGEDPQVAAGGGAVRAAHAWVAGGRSAMAARGAGIEVGAALGAIPVAVAGAAAASARQEADWLAVYLSVAGVAVSVVALLRSDRRRLGWAGGLLLAAATWVRLYDAGVEAPEAYTLPSAIGLLVVGLAHLRANPGSSTQATLGAGLGLALVPSLLWVLDEPGTLRAALLGLACLALVVAGAVLRWSAPLTHAGTVGLVVAIRHAAPYIEAGVPRWALIGGAGVVLVALGITWERRVRELRLAFGYVRRLR